MFVITLDQERSTSSPDRVPELLAVLAEIGRREGGDESVNGTSRWVLPPERTIGDEVQAITAHAPTVVAAVRAALRLGCWQVGVGWGAVDAGTAELSSTREARGPAFIAAREAVEDARSSRSFVPVVIRAAQSSPAGGAAKQAAVSDAAKTKAAEDSAEVADIADMTGVSAARLAADIESMFRILGVLNERRSARAWEYIDATVGASGPAAIATWAASSRETVARAQVAARLGVSAQAVSSQVRRAAWPEELAVLPLLIRLVAAAGAGIAHDNPAVRTGGQPA